MIIFLWLRTVFISLHFILLGFKRLLKTAYKVRLDLILNKKALYYLPSVSVAACRAQYAWHQAHVWLCTWIKKHMLLLAKIRAS